MMECISTAKKRCHANILPFHGDPTSRGPVAQMLAQNRC